VYVLAGDGDHQELRPVQIKTGISDGLDTEVLSGLNEGDRVVISANTSGENEGTSNPFSGGGFPRRR
jgi:multidrug efflux pump subunit AcrA (membrane-fusion protein)